MANTLYKIYNKTETGGEFLLYLGRTKQKLNQRLHGHFFKKPMHREIDIKLVSKIEYAEFETVADMYLYEIYYINKLKPPLNKDDKAKDELTVTLPDVEFKEYNCNLMDKWKEQIAIVDAEYQEKRKQERERRKLKHELRMYAIDNKLSEEERANLFEAHGF